MLILPNSLLIYNVVDIHSQLRELLNSNSEALELDASEVQELDAAGVQLLCSLVKTCEANGIELAVKNCSDSYLNAITLFGDVSLINRSEVKSHG